MQSNEITDTQLAAMSKEQSRWLHNECPNDPPVAVKIHSTHLYSDVLNSYREANTSQRTDMCEALIDAENLKALLSHLQTVCEDKAQHVSENWQDEKLAKRWGKAAVMLGKLANRLPNDPGIGYGD